MTFGIVVWLLGQMIINIGWCWRSSRSSASAAPWSPTAAPRWCPPGRAGTAGRFARPRARRRAPSRSAGRTGRPVSPPDAFPTGFVTDARPPRRRRYRHLALLATADALRRLRPDVDITSSGTPRPGEQVVPEVCCPSSLIRRYRCPAGQTPTSSQVPARLRAAVRTRAVLDRVRPTWSSAATISMPSPRLRKGRRRWSSTSRRRALARNRRRPVRAARVAVSFRTPLKRRVRRAADPADDLRSRPGRRAGRGPAFFGLDPDRPTLLVTGGSRGTPPQPGRVGRRHPLAAARGPGPARAGQARGATPVPTDVPYVVVEFIDRMDLAYAPPPTWSSAVPAPTASPRRRPSGCRPCSCRSPIGSGERVRNARPVVDAGGGSSSTTPT